MATSWTFSPRVVYYFFKHFTRIKKIIKYIPDDGVPVKMQNILIYAKLFLQTYVKSSKNMLFCTKYMKAWRLYVLFRKRAITTFYLELIRQPLKIKEYLLNSLRENGSMGIFEKKWRNLSCNILWEFAHSLVPCLFSVVFLC